MLYIGRQFNPELHTQDAFLSQLEILGSDPDRPIIGSLAQAALLGEEISFRKSNSEARDIDVLGLTGQPMLKPADNGGQPFPVDNALNGQVERISGNTIVRFHPSWPEIQAELPEEVIEPYKVDYQGVSIFTVNPSTHVYMLRQICMKIRPKDIPRHNRIKKQLDTFDDALPQKMFDPVSEIYPQVLRHPEARRQLAIEQVQVLGRMVLPDSMLRAAIPRIRQIKNKVGFQYRK